MDRSTPSPEAVTARRLWPALNAFHAVVYFAPEAPEAFQALGLKGGWMGYFASRGAPLGAAPPEVVTAVFFNFPLAMVSRALPAGWEIATPADVLAARAGAVDAALRRLIPDKLGSPEMAEAAALARKAAEAPPLAGRPLYAGLRALPWPDEAHMVLWHATTLLREHRGDGHSAALVAAGLDGLEAHVVQVAAGAADRAEIQGSRRFSDDEWADAERRLTAKGWLDAAGSFTAEGRAGHQTVEDTTDALAAGPWQALGPERSTRLEELLVPLARTIADACGIPDRIAGRI